MEHSFSDDHSRRAKKPIETRHPPSLAPETFRDHGLTPSKKLRSPARSNESSLSMPTPIPALVVDLKKPTTSDNDDTVYDEDGDEDEKNEQEVSDPGCSTPKASQHPYNLESPLPTSPHQGPQGQYRYHRRKNSSVSSTTTLKPAKWPEQSSQSAQSEQKVLDAMIDELSRVQHQELDEDDVVSDRGGQLKPARNLRRERSKVRVYCEDDERGEVE